MDSAYTRNYTLTVKCFFLGKLYFYVTFIVDYWFSFLDLWHYSWGSLSCQEWLVSLSLQKKNMTSSEINFASCHFEVKETETGTAPLLWILDDQKSLLENLLVIKFQSQEMALKPCRTFAPISNDIDYFPPL